MTTPFRLTFVHPSVGKYRKMKRYIKTWLMEPLPVSTLSALVPAEIEQRFYDDRLETIPFDEPTDAVALSVETYTARRAYEIAAEYRRRGVPVIMGGFHASLCPEEVSRYADTVVVGEAESSFPELLNDLQRGNLRERYQSQGVPTLSRLPNRSIYQNKKYLPISLVEFSRGCKFTCDFCAIQTVYDARHHHRPIDLVVKEARQVHRRGRLFFFIDDNLTSNLDAVKDLLRALIPLKIKWVSQTAINIAHDEEVLDLMKRSGCQGVLIGFESLNQKNLQQMNKNFNLMRGGPRKAMENLRRAGLRVYGTFIFGYDHDDASALEESVDFAISEGLFIAAFNHITPFPGTPLYHRLEREGRLLYDNWWLDSRYRYGDIPFRPKGMEASELRQACLTARKKFYSWSSIAKRSTHGVNFRRPWMYMNYWIINAMHQWDIDGRYGLPLGDANLGYPSLESLSK